MRDKSDMRCRQHWQMVFEIVLEFGPDCIRVSDRDSAIDSNLEFGVEFVADPAGSYAANAADAVDMLGRMMDFRGKMRVDTVEHASEHGFC